MNRLDYELWMRGAHPAQQQGYRSATGNLGILAFLSVLLALPIALLVLGIMWSLTNA